jgi:hypothetical protein
MNWQALKTYIIARLVERGTWLGLIALAGLLGYAIEPDKIEVIAMIGTGLGGLLMVAFSDPAPVQNVTVNPTITIAASEPETVIASALTPPRAKPLGSPPGVI